MLLKIFQINLYHRKAALANLLLKVAEDDIDVILIQEPWVTKDRVFGLKASHYELLFAKVKVRNKLKIFLLADYSGADVVAASIKVNKTSGLY